MDNETKQIIEILKAAGTIAMDEQSKMVVNTKKDTSIVTNGDLAVSKFLDEELTKLSYEVFSEENTSKIPKGKKVVIIDPIDGTESYSRKEDTWAILLGFVNGKEIEKGFVYQPTTQKIYFAHKNSGAFVLDLKNNSLTKLSADKDSKLKAYSSPKRHGENDFLENLGIKNIQYMYSASLKIMEIAKGLGDIYPNFQKKCSIWDLVAPLIILQESGGDMFFGKKFDINYSNSHVDCKFVAVGPNYLKTNFNDLLK